jgi:hypothetical protein
MGLHREESMQPDYEKRASQRIEVEVPVFIGEERALTRDVSWAGIYFLTKQPFNEGGDLRFSLDLTYALPGKPVKLDCQGEVIRVEPQGDAYGVAARINNFQYLH